MRDDALRYRGAFASLAIPREQIARFSVEDVSGGTRELRDVGLLEFGRFDEIVEASRRAANAALADAPGTLFAR